MAKSKKRAPTKKPAPSRASQMKGPTTTPRGKGSKPKSTKQATIVRRKPSGKTMKAIVGSMRTLEKLGTKTERAKVAEAARKDRERIAADEAKAKKRKKAQVKNAGLVKQYIESKVKQPTATRAEVKSSLERAGLTPEKVGGFPSPAIDPKREAWANKPPLVVASGYVFDPINGVEFIPSPQQCSLFDWVRLGRGNSFVRARAGTGKTTSLLRAIQFMKGRIICIAFNVSIRREFEHKLVEFGLQYKVHCKTVHSVGLAALKRSDLFKNAKLCTEGEKRDAMLDAIKPDMTAEFPKHLRSAVVKLVSLAKQTGAMLVWDIDDRAEWDQLVEHYNVGDLVPEEAGPADQYMKDIVEYSREGVIWSRRMASRMIDFDDMLWIPLVEKLKFWQYDWVLVDEAQDLNLIRMMVAEKLMHNRSRLVAVGDENQAIYGFTGADAEMVAKIIKRFNCTPLPLTVTYRCGENIVKEANRFVPDIQSAKGPGTGTVSNMSFDQFEKEVLAKLTYDDGIICRKNAPITALAFKLLRMSIPCHVEGKSIGEGLVSLTKKWKVNDIDVFEQRLDTWYEREKAKLEAKKRLNAIAALDDRVQSLKVIMENCETVEDIRVKIRGMFKDTEGNDLKTVVLSSVHKFKGRERKRIFIYGYHQWMPSPMAKLPWELQQEDNLRYVAITRAIDELVYLEGIDDKQKRVAACA